MRRDISRTEIYKELDKETNKKYFDTKGNAILENVDTLYYSVHLSSDTNENENIVGLIQEIDILKETYKESKEEQTYEGLDVKLGGFSIYSIRLSCPDLYDIYISDYLPNKKTPRIVVQLRSFGLWVHGVDKLLDMTLCKLKQILVNYVLTIDEIKENRFDYAYHTNMIQNPYKFFSDDKILKHVKSTMNTYSKVGDAKLNKDTDNRSLTIDYLSLGHRNSNNIFIRIYNKTREVIEMGYKAFFIEYWYQNRMISFYDKYCIEIAYKKKEYDALHLARLNFYLDYGTDQDIKEKIYTLIKNDNSRYKDYEKLADNILPKITLVNNIEFETKRNFYRNSDRMIDNLKTDCTNELKRIYQIYHNRDIFLNYLTSKTLCFVKDIEKEDYQPWWRRIINKKLSNCRKSNADMIRIYSKEIDFEASLKRSINSIGTTSVYKGNVDTSFVEDFSSILGYVNDNDLHNSDTRIAFVDNSTGEIIQYVDEKIELDHLEYKQKKYGQIKNRLTSTLRESMES